MPRFKKNVGTDFKKFLDQLPGREKWLRPNFGPFLCKKDKKKVKNLVQKEHHHREKIQHLFGKHVIDRHEIFCKP